MVVAFGMILGILIGVILYVLVCCLKAAAEADKSMERLIRKAGNYD